MGGVIPSGRKVVGMVRCAILSCQRERSGGRWSLCHFVSLCCSLLPSIWTLELLYKLRYIYRYFTFCIVIDSLLVGGFW